MFSLYRNPNLDDRIFDCLLASMAAVQAEDIRASFLFVGDLNFHHQEWLGSTTTNYHGVADFDFATVSGCDQLVVGSHFDGSGVPKSTGIQSVIQYRICPGVTFGLLTILLKFLTNICTCWLDVMFTRMTMVIRVRNKVWPQARGSSSVDP